ncbi:MAG TPA: putative Ig domain-containing protein [Bryobacteraceae bacterium]|nr:putative Ig domain-containing protein [Bryobacteraceae bacterium]
MKYYALLLMALPLCAQQLVMTSGNGQVALEFFPSTQPLVVRALDSAGRPMPDVPIEWTADGGGAVSDTETRTDAEGFARARFRGAFVTPGYSYRQWNIRASSSLGVVTFVATSVHTEDGRGQPYFELRLPQNVTGPPGSTFAEPIVGFAIAQTGANQGSGIPNVGISIRPPADPDAPTMTCAGPGGVALTDSRGRAECSLVFGRRAGSGSAVVDIGGLTSRTLAFQVTPGQDCTFSLSPPSQNIGASGGPGSFSVATTSGCAWTATTSASWISITSPTAGAGTGSGQVAFTVAANGGAARTGSISVGNVVFNVNQLASGNDQPLTFSTNAVLPSATVGTPYSTNIAATGGRPPYTWSVAGNLPPNLTLNSSTGVLSGTPATAGTYVLVITVVDQTGNRQTQSFTLQASAQGGNAGPGALGFTTPSLPAATLNVAYSQQITATGGCNTNPFFGGVQVDMTGGSLPPGIQGRSAAAGAYVISGTPTQPGSYSFTLRARDACGASLNREYTITIGGPSTTPAMVASTIGLNFQVQRGGAAPAEQTVTLSSGTVALGFQVAVNAPGNWLEVNPRSGQTSASLSVRVTNTNFPAGTYQGSITITSEAPNSPLVIPVTLTVTEPVSVVATPNNLAFQYTPGGSLALTQIVTVASAQGPALGLPFTVDVTTREGGSWLSVSTRSGTAPGAVAVTANPIGLAPGSYVGTVAIQPAFNAPVVLIPVTLVVNAVIVGPQITSIVNGASFTGSAVAPGEIVTIFGAEMGPATLAGLSLTAQGSLDTTVSDVRVWFDEVPAPLIHVSATQITAIVPYSLGGRGSTRAIVEYRGVRSTSRAVPVVGSAPAIFTAGGSQAAALNENATFNGSLNGATPGSIISLFATGEGQTSPASVDGTIVAPDRLTVPLLPVSLTIGGRQARIVYAGSAPGQVAGLMQINAVIPEETTPGQAAPVVLTVGSNSSQAGVTIAIRQ